MLQLTPGGNFERNLYCVILNGADIVCTNAGRKHCNVEKKSMVVRV